MKKKLQSMIIVTFTKLLVINMVANKLSESPSRQLIFSSEEWVRSSISLRSEGDREKKAISDAEAKPEASKSTPAKIMAAIAENEGGFMVIPLKMSAN